MQLFISRKYLCCGNRAAIGDEVEHWRLTASSLVEGLLCILLTTDCAAGDWGPYRIKCLTDN